MVGPVVATIGRPVDHRALAVHSTAFRQWVKTAFPGMLAVDGPRRYLAYFNRHVLAKGFHQS